MCDPFKDQCLTWKKKRDDEKKAEAKVVKEGKKEEKEDKEKKEEGKEQKEVLKVNKLSPPSMLSPPTEWGYAPADGAPVVPPPRGKMWVSVDA